MNPLMSASTATTTTPGQGWVLVTGVVSALVFVAFMLTLLALVVVTQHVGARQAISAVGPLRRLTSPP